MRKTTVGIALVALLFGIGLGALVPFGRSASQPAAATGPEKLALPLECRSALNLGGQALGIALDGLGQSQSAVNIPQAPGSISPAVGILGQADSRVQGVVQQFNEARAVCTSAIAAPAVPQAVP